VTGALLACALVVGLGAYFLRYRKGLQVVFVVLSTLPLFLGAPGLSLVIATVLLGVLLTQPLYVLLGAVTVVCFEVFAAVTPADYGIFAEKIYELTDKNVLLAIPFFVVSGTIMAKGGIAGALVDVATPLTRWIPGGIANAAIAGSAMFAAISGSSPVTVIAIGGMMFPALVKAGFGERHAMGLLTSAGSLGIVIPPSIPMIIYAIVVSGQQVIDVGDLFLAGMLPGAIIACLLGTVVVIVSLRRSQTVRADLLRFGKGLLIIAAACSLGLGFGPWGWALCGLVLSALGLSLAHREFVRGFWALLLPVLILGGIYSGAFTPTQAAAVSVVYSVVVSVYLHRALKWSDLPALVVESTLMLGALLVLMVVAFVFNDFLVEEQIPDHAVAWMQTLELSRAGFLVALNLFLLLVGCFMDIISAILIVAPLVLPMAMAPGVEIDPIHLGIIFIVNLEVGYLTPPLGLNLFVASALFKRPLGEVVRSVVPYTAIMLVAIALVTYWPSVATGPVAWLRRGEPKQQEVRSIEELMRAADKEQE
jgi:C4-dicarboxylate transporter DctM subunit